VFGSIHTVCMLHDNLICFFFKVLVCLLKFSHGQLYTEVPPNGIKCFSAGQCSLSPFIGQWEAKDAQVSDSQFATDSQSSSKLAFNSQLSHIF